MIKNEPLTRRKEADLKDKKNNVKLDKNKLVKKHNIMIPKQLADMKKSYQERIKKNLKIMKAIQK
jgi:hypothetical protein